MSGVISRVAVCGAGAMGSGIAQVAAQAGATVTVFDVQAAALTAGEARFGAALDMLANKGRISAADAAATRSRTTWTSSLDALADTDLVVEAIIEDAAIKAHLFAALEAIVRPDAIIGSNTSSLAITMLASGFKHPERFVGIHFFNPAPVMKLVEVVAGAATDAAVVDLVQRTAQAWGKVAVAVADVPGFIVNRVARPFYAEAFAAWGEGAADATTIDALMKAAGFRMGPLELTDLIGQDVNFAVARSIYQASFGQTRFVPQPRQAALVDAGWLGRKSGRGVFNYAKAAGSLAQPETGASPDLSPAEPSVVEAVRRQVTGGWSEPFIACQGVLIGPTRGLSARSEAVRERKPCVLLDWFDAQGSGPVAYAATNAEAAAVAQRVLHALSRPGHQMADRPGLIVMRTLAQISNAACDAVLEQVAGEADVDNALRHGANYPFGPFSWLDRVGRGAVIRVLSGIAHETGKPMYQPSEYLRRTA